MNIFKKKKECKLDEYCPIYLSYLGNDETNIKYCKNSNNQYCTKYRLLNEDEWKNLSKKEKLNIIQKINLFNFIKK